MNEIFTNEPSSVVCTCAPGLSQFLSKEIRALGFRVEHSTDTTVTTEGTLADCMILNLRLRTAHRVLYTLDKFKARFPDRLYSELVEIPWERYIDPSGYFSIDKAVENESINNTNFASLKAKDAIVDRIRRVTGSRPNTGNSRHSLCLFLYWAGEDASIYIDTTGESLSFRGYRGFTSEAPMRESLAAAVVMASGWDGRTPFVNPMCGCGTIAIEAAWIAQNRPPALYRENFSFMHLACYEPPMWTSLCAAAIKEFEASKGTVPPIIATDIDANMIEASRENAKLAEVDGLITFDTCDFMLTDVPELPALPELADVADATIASAPEAPAELDASEAPAASTTESESAPESKSESAINADGEESNEFAVEKSITESAAQSAAAARGVIIVNPPYGGRIGDPMRLRDIYSGLGVFIKKHCAAYDGYIFTGNPDLASVAGLSWEASRPFYNGTIECELLINPEITPEAESIFKRRAARG